MADVTGVPRRVYCTSTEQLASEEQMSSNHPALVRAYGGVAALAAAVLLAGCGATRLERPWVTPDVGALNIHRVVAMAISNDPGRRRAMEASMVEQIRDEAPGVEAVESSTLISDADIRQEARVRDHLERAGFDAQLVMRVTDVTRKDVYVPGRTTRVPRYYRTFWGYYRYWAPIAYRPGYIEHDRDVQVETELYAPGRGDDELVYAAVSHTLNPSSAGDLAEDVTGVVAKDLKEKGILE
jgi:hypothetical protein